ncbi:uncharacterized protein E6C27_scaffold1250G00380 [Cucumis melo var. makuwa]|uniref:GST N-terminal domain-containing protein n=1 Tax=Cucumis melo var. makuwa TaxID=1194695 RepID=A0A5A7U7Q3_CUCMM|nr:uncharacterized protein E6C27_scaffold1250G00380 [Cucumis melo var. makuwa]
MEMKKEPIELGSGSDRFARRGWAAVSEERGGEGFKVKETSKFGPRPEKPIEIYEFERYIACSVRKIVAVLDLDILFYPCPRNGPNFRPKVLQMGGKQYFVFGIWLQVDPNTGVSMYESDDIIKYLVQNYGDGNVPLSLSLGLLTTLSEGFAMIGRPGRGSIYKPLKLPPAPLEIWAHEGSPFCKLVREVLVELELPHLGVITKQMTAIEEMVASEYN